MKKILTILLSIISLTLIAQVPQGVGYQGVATDANGIELVNQSISIRASVLSGSATGTVEWEETHATSTDTFGLFSLTIGQGTNTTNGAQTSFADISWGTNTHYLKIEMDVTGGSNYSFMGTNQMMSVPYALYAESANINYDSISNLLSNDSTFITTVGGGMGGDGCDWQFPEGISGDPIFIDLLASSYTVPSGKNLYITTSYYFNGSTSYLLINGYDIIQLGDFGTPIIAKSGDIVHYSNYGSTPSIANCGGILVDINPQVEPIFVDLLANNYTVPNGKQLFITKGNHTGSTGNITVNGNVVFQAWNRPLPHIIKSGDIVSYSHNGTPPTSVNFVGYLVDENYFAGCGGGGSSSATSSLDSTTIANMIAGAGGGCDFKFPQGTNGEPITHSFFNSGNYIVPTGKVLCILTHSWYNGIIDINGTIMELGGSESYKFLDEGTILIGNNSIHSSFNALLMDRNTDVVPISHAFINGDYTVPAGKILYVYTNYQWSGSVINTSGLLEGLTPSNSLNLLLKEGTVLTEPNSPTNATFNGYLVDENYFAGCGGGGSSSSTSSLDSTAIANMIAGAGGGCDWRFPDGLNGEAITWDLPGNNYTVPTGKNLYVTHTSGSSNATFEIDGKNILDGGYFMTTAGVIVCSSGSVISTSSVTSANPRVFNGILVDAIVEPITWDLLNNNYIVPQGKNLYITHSNGESPFLGYATLEINGVNILPHNNIDFESSIIFCASGSVISTSSVTSAYPRMFNGYLVDENYFAGCGGGGSSSATSSTSWNSTVPFLQSSSFPQGQIGESVMVNLSVGSSYTVPAGKNFYILNNGTTGAPEFTVTDNLGNSVFMSHQYGVNSGLLTFGEGFTVTLTSCHLPGQIGPCDASWEGILIDEQYIEAVMIIFSPNSLSYTVPSGKVLVPLSANDYNWTAYNGDWSLSTGYSGPNSPWAPLEENVTITYVPNASNPTVPAYIFGYLINY